MQNIYKDAQEDIGSIQYRRRHNYVYSEAVIDGMTYKIESVMPKSDGDYNPKKISELLAYLVNEK